MVSGGRGDPERMHDRDISGLAYRWNLSPELEADRRSLQVEHAELDGSIWKCWRRIAMPRRKSLTPRKSGCTSADCTH
jgi:hypothetical protein